MINTQVVTIRPTLRTTDKTTTKELIRELEVYTRELQTKIAILDKAILELQAKHESGS